MRRRAGPRREQDEDPASRGTASGGTVTGSTAEDLATSRAAQSTPVSVQREEILRRNPVSWRSIVRWIARILLPIAVVLSTAEVVRLPDGKENSEEGFANGRTVLIVIAHARPRYLQRCLESLQKYYEASASKWGIVVSVDRQDGEDHDDVIAVSADADTTSGGKLPLRVWTHDVKYHTIADASDVDAVLPYDVQAYTRISRHYKWALSRAFAQPAVHRVVILEDDMEIAPDFFAYFEALAPLLESDPSLFCVSAWNDNGKDSLTWNPERLHRTDFFPGLGWMISKDFWIEIGDQWPDVYWDDWLRSNELTRGRHCIRPEVSRTANFGKDGVSQSFLFDQHVSKVAVNSAAVDFSQLDLSYLEENTYDAMLFGRLSDAVLLEYSNYLKSKPQNADVIARYRRGKLDAIGKRLDIMTDARGGVLRTSYKGIVTVPWNGHWAFVVDMDWIPPNGFSLGSSVCCRHGTTAPSREEGAS